MWGQDRRGPFSGASSRRQVGLAALGLLLLVPISSFAAVPYIFASGTVADATQLNADFAAVIPWVGRSSASASISGSTATYVFPGSASFVAPRNMTCVVTIQPFVVTGSVNSNISWRTAIKIGSSRTLGPLPGPAPLSLMRIPGGVVDANYVGTYTEVFSVTSGSHVSFGAQFQSSDGSSYSAQVVTVYSCTIPP